MDTMHKFDIAGQDLSVMSDHAGLIRLLTTPPGWGVSVHDIATQPGKRMDAEHYDPVVMGNNMRLKALGVTLVPLSDLADVHLPGIFTRIWAQDTEYGVPYINATDLMSYFVFGVPAQERYLSRASNVKMNSLIIRKEMILITCSGTIGRVFDVPTALDGWAGTHDMVRIIPHQPELKGFLRAYLASDFAQVQILSHTHGGQIDHVTGDQVASCLVPQFDAESILRISKLADQADQMRSGSVLFMNDALSELSEIIDHGG
ncbi:restriction endonuclease subunit S [Acidithiobacillus thiooxidans]|jgi:type I restriction enzyme S subunit|uniref:Type I restriction modification DNA specificity domain-containing protein n=1 Tax=Acidithiobacillus thiooxidans ATCC 19377 TaxID=637390 RepID=A0A543Q1Y2_ACITH|nr:restriction endonuclease subunit S [Acidithiobacillus thiooxidans]MDD5519133.1 restriction endonuclease subunit S [Candidatus Omnitrophota bacterium]MDX5935526.1 restriction endonuclease subunit S [Acidithiobacillus thiooxidans]TQN50333.1 hypothetical protein DLNHIDIE_00186 [Acidithiobacillus thiooxidans ATCC 19377]